MTTPMSYQLDNDLVQIIKDIAQETGMDDIAVIREAIETHRYLLTVMQEGGTVTIHRPPTKFTLKSVSRT